MKDLYASNRQYKLGIEDIVKDVKEVIYQWDGSVDSQDVRITSSKKHKTLGIYEPIAIRPQVANMVDSGKEEIEQFVIRYIYLLFPQWTETLKENLVEMDRYKRNYR